jgi:uncharacterized phage infection (PIP) family protein YhgE
VCGVCLSAGTEDLASPSRDAWTGNGGRVVYQGSCLIPGSVTTATVLGLQKNSVYVVRVTAVRRRKVVLPDGSPLEQTLESQPSVSSGPMRTLNPGAEIARLTKENNELKQENARIPGLEQALQIMEADYEGQLSIFRDDLASSQGSLHQAVNEIETLQSSLARKVQDLDAAAVEIKAQHKAMELKSGELGEARAEIRHLKDVVAQKADELARAYADIERLNANIAQRQLEVERTVSGMLHLMLRCCVDTFHAACSTHSCNVSARFCSAIA